MTLLRPRSRYVMRRLERLFKISNPAFEPLGGLEETEFFVFAFVVQSLDVSRFGGQVTAEVAG